MGGGSARKEGGSHWKGTKGTYTVCRLDVKRTKIAKIVHLTARIRAALSVLAATAACLLLQQQLLSSLLLANVAHETGLGTGGAENLAQQTHNRALHGFEFAAQKKSPCPKKDEKDSGDGCKKAGGRRLLGFVEPAASDSATGRKP